MPSWLDRLLAQVPPVAWPVCEVVCLSCDDPFEPLRCTERRVRGLPEGCRDAFAMSRCITVRTADLVAALDGRTVPDPALRVAASCDFFQNEPWPIPVELQARLLRGRPDPPGDA